MNAIKDNAKMAQFAGSSTRNPCANVSSDSGEKIVKTVRSRNLLKNSSDFYDGRLFLAIEISEPKFDRNGHLKHTLSSSEFFKDEFDLSFEFKSESSSGLLLWIG